MRRRTRRKRRVGRKQRYIHVHVYACINLHNVHVYSNVVRQRPILTYAYIYMYMYMCMYMYMYMHVFVHVHCGSECAVVHVHVNVHVHVHCSMVHIVCAGWR